MTQQDEYVAGRGLLRIRIQEGECGDDGVDGFSQAVVIRRRSERSNDIALLPAYDPSPLLLDAKVRVPLEDHLEAGRGRSYNLRVLFDDVDELLAVLGYLAIRPLSNVSRPDVSVNGHMDGHEVDPTRWVDLHYGDSAACLANCPFGKRSNGKPHERVGVSLRIRFGKRGVCVYAV